METKLNNWSAFRIAIEMYVCIYYDLLSRNTFKNEKIVNVKN